MFFFQTNIQGGPLERVSIPKEKDGSNRSYGFITYRHLASVQYALSVFSGTRLHNRELRLNYRQRNNPDNNSTPSVDTRSQTMLPQPVLPFMPPMHQFQMHKPAENTQLNPRGASALSNPFQMAANNPFSNMTPKRNSATANSQSIQSMSFDQLLALGSQMLPPTSSPNMAAPIETHAHQTKITHRQENRTNNRNPTYARDRDQRRDDKKRDRSRERTDWVRNHNRNDRGDRNDRNDRTGRGGRGNDRDRNRNDDRRRF